MLAEITGQQAPKTYAFEDYLPVAHEMQEKGFSYADIAKFLGERLSMTISRGQIYRAYQIWLTDRDEAAEHDEIGRRDDGEPYTIDDEIQEKLTENAREVIDMLTQRASNAPYDDPHSILTTAVNTLEQEYAAAAKAEADADAADKQRAALKDAVNAPPK